MRSPCKEDKGCPKVLSGNFDLRLTPKLLNPKAGPCPGCITLVFRDLVNSVLSGPSSKHPLPWSSSTRRHSRTNHRSQKAPADLVRMVSCPCACRTLKALNPKGPTWDFRKLRGTFFWGPYNKDPTTWGTILGPPIFGNLQMKSTACSTCFPEFSTYGLGFRVFG